MRSKCVIRTKSGRKITIYDGYYRNQVFYGNSFDKKTEKSVPVGEIKSKKLTWV